MEAHRYIIITPVRNEETHLRETIESVAAQTIRPVRWIIVNDGSTDLTRQRNLTGSVSYTGQIAVSGVPAAGWWKHFTTVTIMDESVNLQTMIIDDH